MLYENVESMVEKLSFSENVGSNYIGNRHEGWVKILGMNRDSDALSRSNFRSMLELLGGVAEDKVEVSRAGHWVCGWVESILVHVSAKDEMNIAFDTLNGLDDYAIVNEDDFSEEENREQEETFENNEEEFVDAILSFIEIEADELSEGEMALVKAAAWEFYRESCSYNGIESGWVDENNLESVAKYVDSDENLFALLVQHKVKPPKKPHPLIIEFQMNRALRQLAAETVEA